MPGKTPIISMWQKGKTVAKTEIGMATRFLGDRNGVRTPMQWSVGWNARFLEAAEPEQFVFAGDFSKSRLRLTRQLTVDSASKGRRLLGCRGRSR